MIDDYDRIHNGLKSFEWEKSWEDKVDALDKAVTNSLRDIAPRAMVDGRVHLSLSGGVDSTLLLYKLLVLGFPVTAHTMVGGKKHLDLTYAEDVVEDTSEDIRHEVHIIKPCPEDIEESNRVTGQTTHRPDNYFYLMRAVAKHTNKLVSGDVIDELLGGYYNHLGPDVEAFPYYLDMLIPRHLKPLDQCSTAMGVQVFLPYASEEVMACCRVFRFDELVDENQRKRPMYKMARKAGISVGILDRRKLGLVSALVL